MDDNTINSLREALSISPDNIPLRFHLANTLLKSGRFDDAEQEFNVILAHEDSQQAKFGLAEVFYSRAEYSKCNVVLEELIESGSRSLEVLLLHAKALLKENHIDQAIEVYQKVLALNPDFHDEELDSQLRVQADYVNSEEEELDSQILEKPDIDFAHVGGMDHVKKEIDLKIIQPLKHPDLYKAYGKKTGGGILLYGPPGCGKTYMARATAGQVKAQFINVGLNDILDMWIGNSEKNLNGIFEVARNHKPCVLFFDEIDALGASRSDMKQSAGRHVINQFLQELDGVESNNEGVLVLGATNTPWHLDAAFRRPGRFDRIIFVPPPDEAARESIFRLKLTNKPVENIDYQSLARKTKDYSGADIEAVVDLAIEGILEQAIKDGAPKPIANKDLQQAVKHHRPTTREWFASAKNYALYANESGLYDEILDYMNLKK